MNNKKIGVFFVAFLVLNIFTLALVSAAPDMGSIVTGVQNFFTPLLNAIFGQNSDLFTLLLFALIIIAAVYMALERVDAIRENAFAKWTITIATTVLATRYIGTLGAIQALLFPSGVFGVALIAVIPFVIFFWFVEVGLGGANMRVLRKVCWAFYGATFAFLWYKQFYINPGNVGDWGALYLVAALLSLILIFSDGKIQRARLKSKRMTMRENMKNIELAKLMKRRSELVELLPHDRTGTTQSEIRRIDREFEGGAGI